MFLVILTGKEHFHMKKIFNMDNPFWTAMGRVFDIFVLNCLWLLCCVPVFTIGPATTALFYGMFGILRGDGGYPSKDFFKSFKQNFKQGLQLGIPLTLIGAFLVLDMYLCYHTGRGIYTFFLFFFAVLFVVWLAVTLYTFPLLSKFERTNRQILIWAFTLCIKNFSKTLYMFFALILCLWLIHLLPGLIFILPAYFAETCTAIQLTILEEYLPPVIEEDEYGESTEDSKEEEIIPPDDDMKWLL